LTDRIKNDIVIKKKNIPDRRSKAGNNFIYYRRPITLKGKTKENGTLKIFEKRLKPTNVIP
jgi:hypothetical protein